MTNKFPSIASAIKSRLLSAGFKSVYISPDEKIGQNLPAAIIEDASREFEANAGLQYEITHTINIYLLSNKLTDRQTVMGDLEEKAWNALLVDLTLGGLVWNVNPLRTDNGAVLDNFDRMDRAGYLGNCSSRMISLTVFYTDNRFTS